MYVLDFVLWLVCAHVYLLPHLRMFFSFILLDSHNCAYFVHLLATIAPGPLYSFKCQLPHSLTGLSTDSQGNVLVPVVKTASKNKKLCLHTQNSKNNCFILVECALCMFKCTSSYQMLLPLHTNLLY